MVEINLVPDVKQELIQAKRVRTIVIAGAVTVGLAAIGVVVLLAVYLFGVQTVRQNIADASIKDKGQQLADVKDLGDMITIQNQLSTLTKLHNEKNIDSRLFDLLIAINPAAPNNVVFSQTRIDANTKTIRLDGQAEAGYPAAEVLKKTILGTRLSYRDGTDSKTVALTDAVTTTELNYGEDSTGKRVLRFTMVFIYSDQFFARSSGNAMIIQPDKQNATDSFKRVPDSLFGDRARNESGGNQ